LSSSWAVCSSWLRLQFEISPAPTSTTLLEDVEVAEGVSLLEGVDVRVAVAIPVSVGVAVWVSVGRLTLALTTS
jgi:hypothetical protein